MQMQSAIIPRGHRISAITGEPAPDGGTTMTLATRAMYIKFVIENGPWDFGRELPSKSMMNWVHCHGIAVSQELFDTLHLGIPFRAKDIIPELQTLHGYKPKTQTLVLGAVLKWLSIQDEPQILKCGGALWMIPDHN